MKTEGYNAGEHYDEMISGEGEIREHYKEFYNHLKKTSSKKMNQLQHSANQTQRSMGMTFNVYHDNQGM